MAVVVAHVQQGSVVGVERFQGSFVILLWRVRGVCVACVCVSVC